jgi:hypothetical protein
MTDDRVDPILDRIRNSYNVPGETPREAMWAAIEGRLGGASDAATRSAADGPPVREGTVIDLGLERSRREVAERPRSAFDRPLGWAVAAAAVLVLGIGIGRGTAPQTARSAGADVDAPGVNGPSRSALTLAAREHFDRTESLLTMVRADARAGRIDPSTADWARGLLAQTRLLMDAGSPGDPAVEELLLDLELVLIQIVGVAETGSEDEARVRTELELTLRSLEEGEVLPRIQAVSPLTNSGA